MRCRRVLPGSLLPDGSVIDFKGIAQLQGPCWIPANVGRKGGWDRQLPRRWLLRNAGWHYCPARDWPSLKPGPDLVCIVRG